MAVVVHELQDSIRDDVQRRTNGAIEDLEVSVSPESIVLTGRTSRYYYKQLATSAVLDVAGDLLLHNLIDVRPTRSAR